MKVDLELSQREYVLLCGSIDDNIDNLSSKFDEAKAEGKERTAKNLDADITLLKGILEDVQECNYRECDKDSDEAPEGTYKGGEIVTTMYVDRWDRLQKQIAIVKSGTPDNYTASVRLYSAGNPWRFLWINNYREIDYDYNELCLEENTPVFENIRTTPSTEAERKLLFDTLAKASKAWDPSKQKVFNLGWYPREGDYFFTVEKINNAPHIRKIRRFDDDAMLDSFDGCKRFLDNGICFQTLEEAEKYKASLIEKEGNGYQMKPQN